MREIKRSALVPYTPAQMFALVSDIERYPEFVPWVASAQLIERSEHEQVGRLVMERAGMREQFATRNTLDPPRQITLRLMEGPFRLLQGCWTFDSLSDQSGERGTRIALVMCFEFANPLTAMFLSRSFEKSIGELVNAFVTRARTVYAQQH